MLQRSLHTLKTSLLAWSSSPARSKDPTLEVTGVLKAPPVVVGGLLQAALGVGGSPVDALHFGKIRRSLVDTLHGLSALALDRQILRLKFRECFVYSSEFMAPLVLGGCDKLQEFESTILVLRAEGCSFRTWA